VILVVGGLFTCYQLPASSAFVRSTPASQPGQAFGRTGRPAKAVSLARDGVASPGPGAFT
jgi:hypothetical protein